ALPRRELARRWLREHRSGLRALADPLLGLQPSLGIRRGPGVRIFVPFRARARRSRRDSHREGRMKKIFCAGTALRAPLPERARAAAAAGFDGVSLWAE